MLTTYVSKMITERLDDPLFENMILYSVTLADCIGLSVFPRLRAQQINKDRNAAINCQNPHQNRAALGTNPPECKPRESHTVTA